MVDESFVTEALEFAEGMLCMDFRLKYSRVFVIQAEVKCLMARNVLLFFFSFANVFVNLEMCKGLIAEKLLLTLMRFM